MEDKKTLIIEPLKNDDTHKGIKTWTVVHTKHGGYTEDELEIELKTDGTFCIRQGDAWIYLSIEQYDILRKFIKELK